MSINDLLINDFGKIFIKDVRDLTITNTFKLLLLEYNSQNKKNPFHNVDDITLCQYLIVDAVDETAINLLNLLGKNKNYTIRMHSTKIVEDSPKILSEAYQKNWIDKYSKKLKKEKYE